MQMADVVCSGCPDLLLFEHGIQMTAAIKDRKINKWEGGIQNSATRRKEEEAQ